MLTAIAKLFEAPTFIAKDDCPPKLILKARLALIEVIKNTDFQPKALKFISAERVIWPNGALGCGKPGYNYTMALEQGFKILFNYKNKPMAVHTGNHDRMVVCLCNAPVNKSKGL